MCRAGIIVYTLFLLTSVASAEVYKWEDANGMHYTDSPGSVPEKYRYKVYEETREQIRNSKPQVRSGITPQNSPVVTQENQATINQATLEQQKRTSEAMRQQQAKALSNPIESTGARSVTAPLFNAATKGIGYIALIVFAILAMELIFKSLMRNRRR